MAALAPNGSVNQEPIGSQTNLAMSQGASSRPRSRPRSRPAVSRDVQPSPEELSTRFGVKVRDFVYDSKLPPVRTVYLQPRQVQPSVPRPLRREDTEPLDDFSQQSQSEPQGSAHWLERTATEEFEEGPSQHRRMGGFLNVDEYDQSKSQMQSKHAEPDQPSLTFAHSPEPGSFIPTPTVTPRGSLQWKFNASPGQVDQETSRYSSPLTPLPPSPPRQDSFRILPAKRTSSMSSLIQPPTKRCAVSRESSTVRPLVPRYHLRKRKTTTTGPTLPPSKSLKRVRSVQHISAPPILRSVSIHSNQSRKKARSEPASTSSTPRSSRQRGGAKARGRGRRRHS